jgi:hypothetical protein
MGRRRQCHNCAGRSSSARIHRHNANVLVDWLFDFLGPPGAANDEAEQNTRRGLESTIIDEISWAEIDTTAQ